MKYAFILERDDYPVAKWAQYLEVSTSGYYRWIHERDSRAARDRAYGERVKKTFDEGEGTYGADRISGRLRVLGHKASFTKVRRIMTEQGLSSKHHNHAKSLTDSRKSRGDGYPNLLKGKIVTSPFTVLTSDITYIRTDQGFEYLCKIKDMTGMVLAHCMSERIDQKLVQDTILALQKRWKLPPGTIFHSDRGSQYTANVTKHLLASYGFRQSFSRVGKPGDNAFSESFFSILKKEAIHDVHFHTRQDARLAVFDYIERFYNRIRVQAALGYRSPVDWLQLRDRLLDSLASLAA